MPLFFVFFAFLLALPIFWPGVDLITSGYFYHTKGGFYLADNMICLSLHWLAFDGARVLGVIFVLGATLTRLRNKPFQRLDFKAWVYLLLALLIGPGLIANVGLKDHWGRARPREVTEFGGALSFTPVFVPQFDTAHSNGSFVSGDGAFGFFLPAFAYVAPRKSGQKLSRRIFWGSMALGTVFGFVRIAMGAHFLSDVIYAAFLMMAASAALYAALYGQAQMIACWRGWFKSADA